MSTMRRWEEPVDNRWHHKAACRSDNPKVQRLFDPHDDDSEDEEDFYARADIAVDRFCLNCSVMQMCSAEADRHLYLGVYGGEARLRRGIVDTQTGFTIRKPAGLQPNVVEMPVVAEIAPAMSEPALFDFDVVKNKRGEDQYVLLAV